jgi:hypothetical protein
MMSVPFVLDNADPVNVLGDDLNPDAPTTYDLTKWRLFRWNGTGLQDHPNAGNFTSGQALSLIVANPAQIDAGPGLSAPTDTPPSITLNANGWTQVGMPFDFATLYQTLIDSNQTTTLENQIWRWNGNGYENPTQLVPWEGYWVRHTGGSTTLRFPAVASGVITSAPPLSRPLAADGASGEHWTIRIGIQAGEREDLYNYVGVSAQAHTGWDRFDFSDPPPLGPGTARLYFPHNDWGEQTGAYAGDFRSITAEGHVWDMVVEASGATTLALDLSDDIPSAYDVFLLDPERGYRQDLRAQPIYTFQANAQTSRTFQLVVGIPAYVDKVQHTLAPQDFALYQNHPNPFNPATKVRYALPGPSHVKLVVYNTLGQQVRVLVDGSQPAGYHSVVWDGRNGLGRAVASGIYIYRIQTDTSTEVRKMTLLR